MPRAFDQRAKTKRLVGAVGPKIEFETRPRVERRPVEGLVKRGRIEPSQSETVGAERAGEHDLQTVGAVGEVVERLGVGLVGVRMIEPRDDAPGTRGSKRSRPVRRPVNRFDPDAVGGLGHERFEARALKRRLGRFAPVGFGEGGKEARGRAQRVSPR